MAEFSIYGMVSPSLVNEKVRTYHSIDEMSLDYARRIIEKEPEGHR